MDYGKYLFEINKKQQIAKKNQKQIQVKEIKFRPGTDEGDYQVKLRSLIKFLNEGDKTKITLRYRGREMAHKEIGMDLLKRIEQDLEELAVVEQFPKLEVHRPAQGRDLLCKDDPSILAIATDSALILPREIPCFDLNDYPSITEFVWQRHLAQTLEQPR